MKRRFGLLPGVLLALLLTACGGGDTPPEGLQTDLTALTLPETVRVAALGEASHGVKEYQELKAQVFQALVQNNGCRSFIIEGDFARAHTVDAYIHGGDGTAQEAAAQIGFRIYCTQEMADLLTWMRDYNETAPEGQDLHFYGMDIQQVDAGKAYLFQVLEEAAPTLKTACEPALDFLTDDTLYELNSAEFAQGKAALDELLSALDAEQASIEAAVGPETFAFARECANSLRACCDVRGAPPLQYNTLRDQYMAEKVQWYLNQGDGSLLFINGHNGHIGKTSATPYRCLGQHLSESLGDAYFAIGTEAAVTTYNAQNDDGSFQEVTVENENALTDLTQQTETGWYYADAASAAGPLAQALAEKQSMTSLNVGVALIYTVKAVPAELYDGVVVFREVSPTTLLFAE